MSRKEGKGEFLKKVFLKDVHKHLNNGYTVSITRLDFIKMIDGAKIKKGDKNVILLSRWKEEG